MQQMSFLETPASWTVTEVTRYLRQLLEADDILQDAWVQGEISNLARPSSGHIYFSLKDSGATLRCVMWRNAASRLEMNLKDGMAVEVHGSIGIYEPQGQYQLYADLIRSVGEGALYQEFLRLKAQLEAEGLFDVERKHPIPELPRRIGIVTSPTGAALRDMLNTLRRRYPLAEVILAPSPVQGDEAPLGLLAGLQALDWIIHPDVILLARGGGSMEDLWAFNDERVVRAVAEAATPVISGVGHETDFTLVDFAADLRAPTPTAAAELATPVTVDDLRDYLAGAGQRLDAAMTAKIEQHRHQVDGLASRLRYFSPVRRIQTEMQCLDDLIRRGNAAQTHSLALAAANLKGLGQRLGALDPLGVLKRGYAVLSDKDGRVVSSKGQVASGDELRARVQDGEFDIRVTGLEE